MPSTTVRVRGRLAVDADAAFDALVAELRPPDGVPESLDAELVGRTVVVRRSLLGREVAERGVVVRASRPTHDGAGVLELDVRGSGVVHRRSRVAPHGDLACDVELVAELAPRPALLAATVGRLVAAAVRHSLRAELLALSGRVA